MATAQALTAWDAIAALAPLIGVGGVTSMVVAYWSYRKVQAEGRRGEPDKAGIGIGALLADSSSINRLSLALEALDVHAAKALLLAETAGEDFKMRFEQYIDEIRKLRRAVEDLQSRRGRRDHG
ncbi:hypothetical protein OZ411_01400 [Bradyrhizobium sp. Arg237L]|uniref:hypothetical protein n=1 Tax=Bradyrhizobium sp. Arg237L TaxID=3003352 RepID=UPI00249D9C25|nr:hypothetical protein [Bradyrhizobium sp. Arg237L]MDI4231469.1 hypothetical protein [Bradyrhizobium sp. Arg237L]